MRLYEAAIYSYRNILKDYPETEFKEEILFSIFKSNYNYAENSILSKQPERYQSALDAYNELVFQFPDTKYLKEAKSMNRIVMNEIEGVYTKKKKSDRNKLQ
jgi:outer membrane protein assembly factor BamD